MTTLEPLSERKLRVPTDFNRVARRYDLLNALNPGYSKHLRWSAERMNLTAEARILDLCCGTGLSTEALVECYPNAEIHALDGSTGMLDVARNKPRLDRVHFIEGDAMNPRAAGVEGTFDGILMAYGIRNMSDPDLCLRRILDLLRPGGVVAFHEYSVADSKRSRAIWNAVAGTIIIPFGRVATGSADLFRYLRRSVNEFDGATAFRDRLARAGFVNVVAQSMDGWQRGIVHTFTARKPR